jgi:hypothetical protein
MKKLISVFGPVTFMSFEIVFRTHNKVIWELEKHLAATKQNYLKHQKKLLKAQTNE